jgi:hypothetical protein
MPKIKQHIVQYNLKMALSFSLYKQYWYIRKIQFAIRAVSTIEFFFLKKIVLFLSVFTVK